MFFSPRRSLWGSLSYEAENGGPYGAEADLGWPDRTFSETLASDEARSCWRGAKSDPNSHVPVLKDPSKRP